MSSKALLRGTILVSAALITVPIFAANTSTDFDRHVNFRSYHTFSFHKVQTTDPFFVSRIEDEITRDLTKAGWERVDHGGDIAITAVDTERDEKEYNTFYNGLDGDGFGWGGWGCWGGWGGWGDQTQSRTTVHRVPVGTLVVDMYDNKTHQLVWRGKSTEQLSNKSGKNISKLKSDIDHMLNGFPPQYKS